MWLVFNPTENVRRNKFDGFDLKTAELGGGLFPIVRVVTWRKMFLRLGTEHVCYEF
jgi:hypothetical protein